MDRRPSIGIASAALVAGIVLLLVGHRPDDTRNGRVDAVVAELDARIRETSAGVQARAVTLSQLPRLGWAVSTDPVTVRDLTADELAFRPLPGESIEIAQIDRNTGAALRLLRAPADEAFELPVTETGQRLYIHDGALAVATVLGIDAHERADAIRGAVAVVQRLDLSALAQRLQGLGAQLRIETRETAFALGPAAAKTAPTRPVTLASPAAASAKIAVLSSAGGARGRPLAAVLTMLLGFAAAALLWLRGSRSATRLPTSLPLPADEREQPPLAARPRPTPPPLPAVRAPAPLPAARAPTPLPVPPPAARAPSPPVPPFTARAPSSAPVAPAAPEARPTQIEPRLPSLAHLPLPGGTLRPASDRRPTPLSPSPLNGPPPVPSDRRLTPLVPLPTLEASGKIAAGTGADAAETTQPGEPPEMDLAGAPIAVIVDERSTTLTSLAADIARVSDRASLGAKGASTTPEYRALFREFLEVRRTCGEPTDNLDVDKFVVVLGQKRADLIARHGYKDVRFFVGFNDGKAVIRSRGIR